MRTFLGKTRSAIVGARRGSGGAAATGRRPFRLAVLVMVASLIGSVLAVLGLSTAAFAASTSSTTATPTSSTIVLGDSNTVGAVVTGDATDGNPTGTVTFYVCGPDVSPTACTSTDNQVGSVPNVTPSGDDSATATSDAFTPTSTGQWCFAAVYSGDGTYSSSADTTTDGCFAVTSADSSTSSTPTSSSIVLGADNTDGAVVTGNAAGGSPTGSVSFYSCGPTVSPAPCTSTANQVGSAVPVTAGADNTATATSDSFTPNATGFWCFNSVYSGDSNYNTSTDATVDECFDVTTIASPTTTSPTNSTIVLGESNSDSAIVTGNAVGGNPTGSVNFYVCGPTLNPTACTSTAHAVGTAVGVTAGASDTATASSASFTPTAAGTWCFAGVYSGDDNYSGSSDTTTDECFAVTQAPSSTTTVPSTTTLVLGGTVHDGATVTGNAAGGSPTGTVSFYQCGPTLTPTSCTSTANPVGGAVNVAAGAHNTATASSATITPHALGYWCFAGVYSGDGNYTGSGDTTTNECFHVTQATSATTTTVGNTTITLGQAATDTAKVTGNAGGGSPTGTVSFYECGPTSTPTACTSLTHPVGSAVAVKVTAGASNTATATSAAFTPTAVGYWCFGAYYSGDTNYKTSSDTATAECVDVKGPLTIITKSLPHGLVGSSYSATLVARGGTTPYSWSHTGTLPHGISLNTSTGVLSGTPTASGSYPLVFKVGDQSSPRQTATQSLTLVIDLHAIATSTTTTPAHSTIVLGTTNTDAAKVTGTTLGGSPTGTVTFYACGPNSAPTACTSTTGPVGSAVSLTAGAHDTATATSASFTPTAAGYWCFAAVYSGDFNYNSSSDKLTAECFNVTPATSATATVPTSASIALGHSNTDEATVTGNTAGGSPTGTVTFYQCGSTPIPTACTSTANPVGSPVDLAKASQHVASATSALFTPTTTGYWCFAAVYSGDTNYGTSVDTTTDECFVVTAGHSTTVGTPVNATIAVGQTASDLATVTGNTAAGAPTGTVTFYQCGPTSAPTACTTTHNEVGIPVNLTAGTGTSSTATSTTFTPSSVGYWCFAAYYSGDTNYSISSDTAVHQCVNVTGHVLLATTSLPHGTKGTAYSFSLVARGGTTPYSWSHTGSLPHGMTLSTTGVLSGTPTVSGSFPIVVKVGDSSHPRQFASKNFTLVIAS